MNLANLGWEARIKAAVDDAGNLKTVAISVSGPLPEDTRDLLKPYKDGFTFNKHGINAFLLFAAAGIATALKNAQSDSEVTQTLEQMFEDVVDCIRSMLEDGGRIGTINEKFQGNNN